MSEVDAQPGARPSLLRDPVLALLVVQSPQEIQGSWAHQDFVDGVTAIVRDEDVPPKLVAVRRHQRHRGRERATLDRIPVVLVLVHAEPRLLVGPVEIHVCKVEEGLRHVYFLSHTVPDLQEQRHVRERHDGLHAFHVPHATVDALDQWFTDVASFSKVSMPVRHGVFPEELRVPRVNRVEDRSLSLDVTSRAQVRNSSVLGDNHLGPLVDFPGGRVEHEGRGQRQVGLPRIGDHIHVVVRIRRNGYIGSSITVLPGRRGSSIGG